jgi:crotonobetainyl-CoA:carnitine CoA-transferase CaiB-like acyl-CoA transferase
MAGRLLASLGATVIRIEPAAGHPLKTADPRSPVAPRYAWYTLDKQIIRSDDASLLPSLAAGADLLVEDLGPGALDVEPIRAANPGIVILSLSHYGQDGPYRDWAGSALTSFALGGSLFRSGRATEAPLPPPVELADTIGGITGVLAAVAALVARKGATDGDHIDCSIAEACLATSDWGVPTRSLMGTTMPRNGAGPVYPVYRVADGFVRILNLSARQWNAFVEWMKNPPEFAAPEWQILPWRAANADVVDLVCEREIGDRPREELFHEGQQRGVSIVPVYAPEDVPHDAHFRERQALAEVEHPEAGTLNIPRSFVRFGKGTIPPAPAAPTIAPTAAFSGKRVAPPGLDFSKLRVVELGSGGVAPEAARHFGLLGADVIKIEHPSAMDFLRGSGGPGMHEHTGTFSSSNRNKRSVELDLKTEEGRGTLFRLLSVADVFFENNSGGVCDRLGIGYEAVAAVNPRIVYASSQMMGATGPASSYSGFGPSNHAVSGIAHLWSAPDNPKPEGNMLVHPDHLAGKTLAIAALAALGERQRTGRGCFIDLAQAEFAMATIGEAFAEVSMFGSVQRRGQDHPAFVPHGVFPTVIKDEWVAVAVETDDQWARLREALGNPDWAADPALDTIAGRLAARPAIAAGLAGWTSQRTRPYIVNTLQRFGVPAMQVMAPVDQLADVHLNERGAFATIVHPLSGPARFEGQPYRFERLQLVPESPAPILGAHTAEVLREWLGEAGS